MIASGRSWMPLLFFFPSWSPPATNALEFSSMPI